MVAVFTSSFINPILFVCFLPQLHKAIELTRYLDEKTGDLKEDYAFVKKKSYRPPDKLPP